MKMLALACAALALVGSAATPAAAREELQVLSNGLPVGEVAIEDRGPFRFIIDTGASNTNILPRLQAALPDLGEKTEAQSLQGAGGAAQVQAIRLSSVTVQGRSHADMPAFLLPPGPVDALGVDGVLGADILSRYVLDIDLPNRSWSLADRLPALDGRASGPIPLHLDEAGAPIVTVTIEGHDITALLDTGARGTILNWSAARLLGIDAGDPDLASGGSARGATSDAGTSMKSRTFAEVAVGDYRWRDARLHIADLPIFAAIGMADGPAMILGMDAFAASRLVIDHPGGQMFVTPASPD